MQGSFFIFTRDLGAKSGRVPRQTITVFAADLASARRVVLHELDSLQQASKRVEPAFAHAPRWTVEEVALDQPKALTSLVVY